MNDKLIQVISKLEPFVGEYAAIAEAQCDLAGYVTEGMLLDVEAANLVRKYGFMLPTPAKDFFRKLAAHLNWQELKKELK